jgi:hypothetical protein
MKTLFFSLSAITIGCVIALAWVLGKPIAEDPRVTQLEAELKTAKETISQLKKQLEIKPVSPVAAATPSPTIAPSAITLEPEASLATGTPTGPAALRQVLKDPTMRELLSKQQAMQIETSYAGLIEYLNLNDQEKAHFKNLLTQRAQMEADLALRLLDGKVTAAERQTIVAEVEKGRTAYNETIRKFLNNENDWNAFQSWENTKPERTHYETIGRTLFNSTGDPLNQQQEQQLIQAMSQSRQSPTTQQMELMRKIQNPSELNESNIKAMLDYQRAANEQTLQKAASFLNENQLKALKSYQERILMDTESGYRMGNMLMQNNSK